MSSGEGRVLVVVPTYNEADSIVEVIDRLFASMGERAHLLVVDDGSPDGTVDVVRGVAGERSDIAILERMKKEGLGPAYVAGFGWGLERGYNALVEMDADLSHDPGVVPQLVAALDDADLAIGSRYVPGGGVRNWNALRRWLSRAGNIYARFWLRLPVQDSTAGFRAFRAEWLRGQDLTSVASHGYAFQIEMTRRVHRDGGRIVEVPITFVERVAGRSKMSKRIVMEALWEVTVWGVQDRLGRFRKAKRSSPRSG